MADFRAWVKISLFASSYIPLWIAMALKTQKSTISVEGIALPWISIVFVALTVGSGVILHQAIGIRKRREPKYQSIESYKSRNDLLTSYLIAYIFPFISLDYGLLTNWLIFGLFIGVLGAIQIRSTHLHVNPVLAALGYDIYEINDGGKGTNMLVAKNEVDLDQDAIKTVELSDHVYLTV